VSYDLLVATPKRPKPDVLGAFVDARGLAASPRDGSRAGSNSLLVVPGRPGQAIDVDGPARVELDDLPDDLAGVVPKAGWLVEIHVPAGSSDGLGAMALDLAIHLARAGDGAVFDPQEDRVAWPAGVTPRPRGAHEDRIRVVQLDWFVPASSTPPDAARRWLHLARGLLPGALPVRFGGYEPFQGRLERDGDAAFEAAWAEEAAKDFGGMLFWSATSGGYGGSAFFADRTVDRRPARLGRVHHLSAEVDARPLHRDPERCEALVAFFAETAATLGAAFAAGTVMRDAILARGRLSYDVRSEAAPLPRASWWVGLPALQTWLAWYGPVYRDLVQGSLGDAHVRSRPEGLLVRHGAEPMDVDEVRGVAAPLPSELLTRRRDGRPVDPTIRITLTSGPPSEAADSIPFID
jgi:hypothetical protein